MDPKDKLRDPQALALGGCQRSANDLDKHYEFDWSYISGYYQPGSETFYRLPQVKPVYKGAASLYFFW